MKSQLTLWRMTKGIRIPDFIFILRDDHTWRVYTCLHHTSWCWSELKSPSCNPQSLAVCILLYKRNRKVTLLFQHWMRSEAWNDALKVMSWVKSMKSEGNFWIKEIAIWCYSYGQNSLLWALRWKWYKVTMR